MRYQVICEPKKVLNSKRSGPRAWGGVGGGLAPHLLLDQAEALGEGTLVSRAAVKVRGEQSAQRQRSEMAEPTGQQRAQGRRRSGRDGASCLCGGPHLGGC